MNRRGVQRGYNNSYYPNDPVPYYYEEDDPNDDEEHARQYTLELDWLASVREGEKVDLKTQEYEWTLARVAEVTREQIANLPLRLVVTLEACGTKYNVDLERRNQRGWLAPAFTHTQRPLSADQLGFIAALREGDAVDIKVAKVGWRPAQVTWADVDGDGVARKVTVLWDWPDGFCTVDFTHVRRLFPRRLFSGVSASLFPTHPG